MPADVSITIALDGLAATQQGLQQVGTSIGGLGTTAQQVGQQLQTIGQSLSLYVTAPLAAAGAGVLALAGSFEQQMNRVQAFLAPTGAQMDALRQKALDLGQSTVFSATEAAGAFEELGKAGISADDILGGVADAATSLAAATGTSLANASTIAANAMTQFNLQAGDVPGIVDTITNAVNSSTLGIDDMRQAMGQAGGAAGALGVDFRDFSTALTMTSSAFTSGSDAGTSFKNFIVSLSPDTKEAADAMADLGLKFFDAKGAMLPMRDIVAQLETAFGGLTEEQRITAAQTIFGTDAMRTALTLADGGVATWDEYASKIDQVGTAQQAATTLMGGFRGAVEQLWGAVETLAIRIGDSGLLGAATALVGGLTDVVNWLADASPEMMRFGTAVSAAVAAIGPVLVVLGTLAASIGAIGAPVALAIAAVVSLGVFMFAFADDVAEALGDVRPYLDALGQGFVAVRDTVGAAIDDLVAGFDNGLAAGIGNALGSVVGLFGQFSASAVTALADVAQELGTNFGPSLERGLGPAVQDALQAATALFAGWWPLVAPHVQSFVASFLDALDDAFGVDTRAAITAGLDGLRDAVADVFDALPGAVQGPLNTLGDAIFTAFEGISVASAATFEALGDGIPAALGTALGHVAGVVVNLGAGVVTAFGELVANIVTEFAGGFASGGLEAGLQRAFAGVVAAIQGLWSLVAPHVAAFVDGFVEGLGGQLGVDLPVAFQDAIGGGGAAIERGFTDLQGAVSAGIQELISWASDSWAAGIAGAFEVAASVGQGIQDAVAGLSGDIMAGIQELIDAGASWWSTHVASLFDVGTAAAAVRERLAGLYDAMREGLADAFNRLAGDVSGWFTNLFSGAEAAAAPAAAAVDGVTQAVDDLATSTGPAAASTEEMNAAFRQLQADVGAALNPLQETGPAAEEAARALEAAGAGASTLGEEIQAVDPHAQSLMGTFEGMGEQIQGAADDVAIFGDAGQDALTSTANAAQQAAEAMREFTDAGREAADQILRNVELTRDQQVAALQQLAEQYREVGEVGKGALQDVNDTLAHIAADTPGMIAGIRQGWVAYYNDVTNLGRGWADATQDTMRTIQGFISTSIQQGKLDWDGLKTHIVGILADLAAQHITAFASRAIESFTQVATGGQGSFNVLSTAGQGLWQSLTSGVTGFQGAGQSAMAGFASAGGASFGQLGTTGQGLFASLGSLVSSFAANATSLFQGFVSTVSGLFSGNLFNSLSGVFSSLGTIVSKLVGDWGSSFATLASNMISGLSGASTTVGSALRGLGGVAIQVAGTIGGAILDAGGGIGDFFGDLFTFHGGGQVGKGVNANKQQNLLSALGREKNEVIAVLERGEFVVNASAAATHRDLLEAINAGGLNELMRQTGPGGYMGSFGSFTGGMLASAIGGSLLRDAVLNGMDIQTAQGIYSAATKSTGWLGGKVGGWWDRNMAPTTDMSVLERGVQAGRNLSGSLGNAAAAGIAQQQKLLDRWGGAFSMIGGAIVGALTGNPLAGGMARVGFDWVGRGVADVIGPIIDGIGQAFGIETNTTPIDSIAAAAIAGMERLGIPMGARAAIGRTARLVAEMAQAAVLADLTPDVRSRLGLYGNQDAGLAAAVAEAISKNQLSVSDIGVPVAMGGSGPTPRFESLYGANTLGGGVGTGTGGGDGGIITGPPGDDPLDSGGGGWDDDLGGGGGNNGGLGTGSGFGGGGFGDNDFDGPSGVGFQTGGDAVFASPTWIQVGEAGRPERVRVSPLAGGGPSSAGRVIQINGPIFANDLSMNQLVKRLLAEMERETSRHRFGAR